MRKTRKSKSDPYRGHASAIEDALLYMNASGHSHSGQKVFCPLPATLLFDINIDPLVETVNGIRKDVGNAAIDAMPKPFVAAMLGSAGKSGRYELSVVRDADRRGLGMLSGMSAGLSGKRLVKLTKQVISHDGSFTTSETMHVESPRGFGFMSWDPLVPGMAYSSRTTTRFSGSKATNVTSSKALGQEDAVAVTILSELVRLRSWRINVTPEGFPFAISLITDPTGVLDVLRFRDLPAGETRRKAMLHWVRSHHRKIRDDPVVLAEVRRHLRGSTRCVWYGMDAVIELPQNECE